MRLREVKQGRERKMRCKQGTADDDQSYLPAPRCDSFDVRNLLTRRSYLAYLFEYLKKVRTAKNTSDTNAIRSWRTQRLLYRARNPFPGHLSCSHQTLALWDVHLTFRQHSREVEEWGALPGEYLLEGESRELSWELWVASGAYIREDAGRGG